MFVLNNAWSTLRRHPWRSILTVLIAVLVAFASLFTGAVRQANDTATGSGYNALKPAAAIRPNAATLATRNGADPAWTKNYLSWSDYTTYANALQTSNLQFSYTFTESLPVRQSGPVKAIKGTADRSANATGGEFTLFGLYDAKAATNNGYGAFSIVSGKGLDYTKEDKQSVLISQAVASANKLKVGSTFTVRNPSDASKTYTLKVRGIYAYSDAAPAGSGPDVKLAKDNRENAIFSSYYVLGGNGLDAANAKDWSVPDLNIMFELSSMTDYHNFVKTMKTAKLPAKYTVTSPTITAYNKSIAPLGNLSRIMVRVAYASWTIGGLLLVALVAWGLSGRRGEISTALVIGVSKARLGWQFMLEVLIPTIVGLAIGTAAGALGSKPLGAALAAGQMTGVTAGIIWRTIGWGLASALVLAVIALIRVLALRTSTIFTAREEVSQ